MLHAPVRTRSHTVRAAPTLASFCKATLTQPDYFLLTLQCSPVCSPCTCRSRPAFDEQDAKAALADPAHVPRKDRPEATFLPGLVADFLQTLKNVVPSADGKRRTSRLASVVSLRITA